MSDISITSKAQEVFPEVREIRKTIHQHPEIGRHEVKTSALIREKLAEYGVDDMESLTPTSVVAYIKGSKDNGRCVALRADIDALPVQEETGVEWASKVSNMMHACNHDMHTSMLLGVAKILTKSRDSFQGTVKLIFQHSEDTMPGGAKELCEKGVMEGVDAIFGMHMFPDVENAGKIGFFPGPLTTSVDIFDVTVHGQGSHGSEPQKGHDPIMAACQAVVLLQQVQSRYTDPRKTVILPINKINGGEAVNVIPSTATFSSCARTYDEDTRRVMCEQFYKVLAGVEVLSGCKFEVSHLEGYPASVNDPKLTLDTQKAVEAVLGAEHIYEMTEPMSFSEDFSYFELTSGKPGVYMLLHAKNMIKNVALHNPSCLLDDEVMPVGMTAMATAAINFLNK